MADIFISYKKEDAGRVIRMVEALRAEGFEVWWDHGIKAGSEWDRSIHDELYSAKVVIAIWSNASVAAPWVKEEATVGKNRGVLVPAMIDQVEPPLGFMMIQAANLVGWRGDRDDERWTFFVDAIRSTMRGGAVRPPSAPLRPPSQRSRNPLVLPIAGGVFALVVAIGVAWGLLRERAPVSGAAPQSSQQVTENEQKLWDKAMAEKTRQGFQSYLLSYPGGAYAQRARDTLLSCRTETHEVWKAGPDLANQMVRGVSSGPISSGMTAEQHCAKAKSDVQAQAKLMCETITTNGGYRNPKWTVTDTPCNCERPNAVVMTCIADLPYSCRWEMKIPERTEICG